MSTIDSKIRVKSLFKKCVVQKRVKSLFKMCGSEKKENEKAKKEEFSCCGQSHLTLLSNNSFS